MGRAEPCDQLLARLSEPALVQALTPWLGAAVERVRSALPRLVAESESAFRGPDLLVECSAAPDDGQRVLGLVLGSGAALDAVERVLGGESATDAARPLSAAECGLLGYGLARALSASRSELRLREVRNASAAQLDQRARGSVLWPISLEGAFGSLELRLLISPVMAGNLPCAFPVRATLHDLPAAGVLEGLAPGAVLLGERFLLTPTSAGLAGALSIEASGVRLNARLDGGTVRTSGPIPTLPGELTLVLAERDVGLLELARIAAGRAPAFVDLDASAVRLELSGRPLAEGELVSYRGALGVRITRCDSAGSPAPPLA